ncbi:MAG: DUF3556 domain-containing protein [Deltaproteobacteria bacterium]|nr:DUF3556 domain-containing protein [Deltaproteobacteria bacterium]
MSLLTPKPTPYDPLVWSKLPFGERGRQVCEAWALDGYGTPFAIYAVHALKIALYIAGWIGFCSFTPGLGSISHLGDWWLSPIAFEKAILWSLLFEGLGLGCGFGPLTGRYFPPVGGALYFLRPGTTKLALRPTWPVIGGIRRSWLDVLVYLAIVGCVVRALVAAAPGRSELVPLVALIPLMGILDRTAFLAMRAEHYGTVIVCLAFAGNWIAGAMAVQLALWFWAGVSKLNHHFPTVVCVMTSNSPCTRFGWLRRRMYRAYPTDLRPSRFAELLSHAGTALELSVAMVFLLVHGTTGLVVGIALALALHGFITSNVPMGVPLEWNVMAVYSVFALFWAHPEVTVLDVGQPIVSAFLVTVLIGVPLLGNLFPARISFLLAMRYYAGNWPYSVWLFRGDSHRKLEQLTKPAPWVYDQLDRFYERPVSIGLVGKVIAFRLMHLQGRALPQLIPKAVDDLTNYEYLDGEIIAGLALGWNFGDGHLHQEALLAAIQAQCGFLPGELRCVFVESQPLGRKTMAYRIHDAATGLLEAGTVDVPAMRTHQPWERSAA